MEAARETEILITSTSTESFEDAVQRGFSRATATLRDGQSIEIRDQRMLFKGGNVVGYQVNLLVSAAGPEAGAEGLGVVLEPGEFRRLLEAEEELEDIKSYDEALTDLGTGEDVLTPWEKSKERIEEERSELRSKGEL